MQVYEVKVRNDDFEVKTIVRRSNDHPPGTWMDLSGELWFVLAVGWWLR